MTVSVKQLHQPNPLPSRFQADLRRTRSDQDCFRSSSWRQALKNLLQQFCNCHRVQYKQGMNEVAAPFLLLSSHSPPDGQALPYVLFEAFVFRFLDHFYCRECSSSLYLFKAFRLFQLLLMHFDPQLGLHLYAHDFVPELYAPQWFLCLFSRGLALPLVLRIWDMLIAVDDPAFPFFLGLALLLARREELLLAGEELPEVIGEMKIAGDEVGVDKLLGKRLLRPVGCVLSVDISHFQVMLGGCTSKPLGASSATSAFAVLPPPSLHRVLPAKCLL